MRRLGVVLAGLALVLTGCVRVSTETTLGEDDTFSQHAVVAMTSQARTALTQQLGDLTGMDLPDGVEVPDVPLDVDALLDVEAIREQLAPLEEAYPGSVTVSEYSDDDGREGVEIDVVDVPLDAITEAAGSTPFGAGTAIVREGDAFVVTIETGAASQAASLGGAGDQLALIESAVDVEVAFTFPGLVREASAGEITGNTVRLGLGDLLSADEIRVVGGAESQFDWGPFVRWGLVALGALILIGGAAALIVQDRRRRSRTHLPPPRDTAGDGIGTLGDGGAPRPPAGDDTPPPASS